MVRRVWPNTHYSLAISLLPLVVHLIDLYTVFRKLFDNVDYICIGRLRNFNYLLVFGARLEKFKEKFEKY